VSQEEQIQQQLEDYKRSKVTVYTESEYAEVVRERDQLRQQLSVVEAERDELVNERETDLIGRLGNTVADLIEQGDQTRQQLATVEGERDRLRGEVKELNDALSIAMGF